MNISAVWLLLTRFSETESSARNTLALNLKGAAKRSNSNRCFTFQQIFQSFEVACVLSHDRLVDNFIHDVFERPANFGLNNGRQFSAAVHGLTGESQVIGDWTGLVFKLCAMRRLPDHDDRAGGDFNPQEFDLVLV